MSIPGFRYDGWLPEGHHPAEWEEITERFGGQPGSGRSRLTGSLLTLRDQLRSAGIRGRILLDGSFISAREEPGDFDVLIIADNDIQSLKDSDEQIARLLDAQQAESLGYSLFFTRSESPAIAMLNSLWDT